MKIIFMGTPEFAVPSLQALISAGHEIPMVVTQPDRKGNRNKIMESPVKVCAAENNIRISQPLRIKNDEEFINDIRNIEPDMIVVAAFGQILPQSLLDIPKYGCLNVHGSLLPKLRGASPMQQSIIDGLDETGITIMRMDAGLDTGDMISKESCNITGLTIEELSDKLSKLGAELLVKTISEVFAGNAIYTKQDDSEATHTGLIKKADGFTDFNEDAAALERKIRAYHDWPCLYTYLDGLQVKFYKAEVVSNNNSASDVGSITQVEKDGFLVACKNDSLKILELQLQGKNRMNAADFMRGHKLSVGDRFGDK